MNFGPDFFVYCILIMAGGTAVFIQGLRRIFLKRMIDNIPTSRINSIAMGLVEVCGNVVPIKTMKAPLSEEECVYFRVDHIGKGIEFSEPFYVKDGTGRILVEPKKAAVEIGTNKDFDFVELESLPKNMDELVSMGVKRSFFKKKYKYTEYLIRPKGNVYVMGTAAPAAGSPKNSDNLVIKKGENDRIFFISDKSEKDIHASMKWEVKAGVMGGIMMVLTGLVFLIAFYG